MKRVYHSLVAMWIDASVRGATITIISSWYVRAGLTQYRQDDDGRWVATT